MLLDDVMSELDRDRRRALVELLRAAGGQSVITTTDLEQCPAPIEPASPGSRSSTARVPRTLAELAA